jgi:hypothetical protein
MEWKTVIKDNIRRRSEFRIWVEGASGWTPKPENLICCAGEEEGVKWKLTLHSVHVVLSYSNSNHI